MLQYESGIHRLINTEALHDTYYKHLKYKLTNRAQRCSLPFKSTTWCRVIMMGRAFHVLWNSRLVSWSSVWFVKSQRLNLRHKKALWLCMIRGVTRRSYRHSLWFRKVFGVRMLSSYELQRWPPLGMFLTTVLVRTLPFTIIWKTLSLFQSKSHSKSTSSAQ